MRKIILESPFAGHHDAVPYARACMRDALRRGNAPMIGHLFYTQVLDDKDPAQRATGIEAGLAWGPSADATVVYHDLGISPGMLLGIIRAQQEGRPVEYRTIGWGRPCY